MRNATGNELVLTAQPGAKPNCPHLSAVGGHWVTSEHSSDEEIITCAAAHCAELLYDLLRFARDEFRDENGLALSNDENALVQTWVDQLEPLLPVNSEGTGR